MPVLPYLIESWKVQPLFGGTVASEWRRLASLTTLPLRLSRSSSFSLLPLLMVKYQGVMLLCSMVSDIIFSRTRATVVGVIYFFVNIATIAISYFDPPPYNVSATSWISCKYRCRNYTLIQDQDIINCSSGR